MRRTSDFALEYGVTGYHEYLLEESARLSFVSCNLARMLGMSDEEAGEEGRDVYRDRIYPEDGRVYDRFLDRVVRERRGGALAYRLLKKDGGILHVHDTITVVRDGEDRWVAASVLTDITSARSEGEAVRFLEESVPYGFIKYTCEDNPRVLSMNERMREMMLLPASGNPGGETEAGLLSRIPPEEHDRFRRSLQRVRETGSPLAGEIPVIRCDGSRGVFFGWVSCWRGSGGREEFQSVCIDISRLRREKDQTEISRYLRALMEVYEMIFEFDTARGLVRCLHAPHSDTFRSIINIPMHMQEATDGWLREMVHPDDQELFGRYFHDFFRRRQDDDSDYHQITYRAYTKKGSLGTYMGLFIKVSESDSLFCCRKLREAEENASLKSEIVSLKNMQEVVMNFSDGIAAFEVRGDRVRPLYTSENVSRFFGYSDSEWLEIMQREITLQELIAHSKLSYDQIQELFREGQGEFIYYDLASSRNKRIRAICSQRRVDDATTRYVMLYEAEGPGREESCRIRVRTFGYFDVFVDGRPIAFRSEKAKELLAILVDRRGGFVSSEEAISYLWPDEPASSVTMSRYRKVALRLKNILSEYGAEEIMESVDGKRRLVAEQVSCDLYDYLTGKEEYAQTFKGSYLMNYSWGETTLGELLGESY